MCGKEVYDMKRQRKKLGLSEWAGRILLVSLALSVVFSVVRLIQAPSAIPEGEPFQKVKSDYMLMVLQCTLGLIVMLLPLVWYAVAAQPSCIHAWFQYRSLAVLFFGAFLFISRAAVILKREKAK